MSAVVVLSVYDADVGARAPVHDDLAIETRAEDVRTDETLARAVAERMRQTVVSQRNSTRKADEGLVATDCERRETMPSRDVRIALDDASDP